MYKVTEKNGKESFYLHYQTVFYKIFAITGDKKEAMKASDYWLSLKHVKKYAHNDFTIELI